MNLKIKTSSLELEITNGDVTRIEKALLATFAYLQGESFNDVYGEIVAEERPVNSKRNYIEPVDGVKKHANGTLEYKCAYSCSCGHKGVRYVHADAESTTCHKCKGTLSLFSATENDAHDEEFNYFVAY